MSWICEESNHIFKAVPSALIDESVNKANEAIEAEEMGDEW